MFENFWVRILIFVMEFFILVEYFINIYRLRFFWIFKLGRLDYISFGEKDLYFVNRF